jgi:trk system potassium uptake protein TrkA
MNIIISGCGKIGLSIIDSLVKEGHDITIIDVLPQVIEDTANVHDTIGVCGNCTDCEVLKEARVDEAELFVAVTGSDETNMLACFLAKRLGARHTIARIRNPEYNYQAMVFLRQQLDLSMVLNPEMLAAQELYNILKFPSADKIEHFSRRNFEMIEISLKPDSVLDDVSLIEMREKYKAKVLVCAVQRGEDVFIPNGSFRLKGGDKLGITATSSEMLKFFKEINAYQKHGKDTIILGGSRIAYYLSKMLIADGSTVKVIDKDQDICTHFCDDIPKATVVLGDGTLQELLLEEGIKDTDAFVSLTGIDETNILVSVLASSFNVPKVIAKINRDELHLLAENLGLDTIVSPKRIVADVLVGYARALRNSLGSNIETLYRLMDDHVEAIEFLVSDDFNALNVSLKEMHLKKNILIAGIIRAKKPLIPTGNDVILAGDKVIIIAADRRIEELSDILE